MLRPEAGRVSYDGQDIGALRGTQLRAYRRQVQPVFQLLKHAPIKPRGKFQLFCF